YLGRLLALFREAIGQAHVCVRTLQEITSVSRALGQEDTGSLEATLNYLLTNRRQKIPSLHSLNSEEERILRYVQQSVSLNLMRDGVTPSVALDMTARNMEPGMYASNRPFTKSPIGLLASRGRREPRVFHQCHLEPALATAPLCLKHNSLSLPRRQITI
ncbi:hypothetical protein C5L27_13635, partial [Staphylococcus argenteus]